MDCGCLVYLQLPVQAVNQNQLLQTFLERVQVEEVAAVQHCFHMTSSGPCSQSILFASPVSETRSIALESGIRAN